MYILNDLIPLYDAPEELWRMVSGLDIITLNHSVRVCEICRIVEQELGFTDTNLSEAGMFHDIGKFFISTKLLNKRGKLNDIERIIIDSHSYFSYKILSFFNIKEEVCRLSLYHHKLNPITYLGDEILDDISDELERKSKIIKTIDIYEALTTDRPYHRGVDVNHTVDIIAEMGDYDKETLNILVKRSKDFE